MTRLFFFVSKRHKHANDQFKVEPEFEFRKLETSSSLDSRGFGTEFAKPSLFLCFEMRINQALFGLFPSTRTFSATQEFESESENTILSFESRLKNLRAQHIKRLFMGWVNTIPEKEPGTVTKQWLEPHRRQMADFFSPLEWVALLRDLKRTPTLCSR